MNMKGRNFQTKSQRCSIMDMTGLMFICASLSVLLVPVQGLSCVSFIYNSHFYSYCSDLMDRETAEFACSLLPNKMRLAVLETQTDFDYWNQWFKSQAPNSDVWIGAKFSKSQNAWWWDEDFQVSLTFFSPTPPNTSGVKDGACLTISADYDHYLGEVSCSGTRGFLCQESYSIDVSTEPASTTESITQGTTDSAQSDKNGYCECACSENVTKTPHTRSEQRAYLEKRHREIKRELFVDTKALSASLRRMTSAEDQRHSAQSMGFLGVAMLSLVFGSIFAMDIPSLWHNFKKCFEQ